MTALRAHLGDRPQVEDGERLDLHLTTALIDFPVAGAAWGWLGCGGRWWFQQVRLPAIRRLFTAYHEMVHEQMMLYYVAALKGEKGSAM